MMDYGYGMMGGGMALWGGLFGLLVIANLILLAIWLWKQIMKK